MTYTNYLPQENYNVLFLLATYIIITYKHKKSHVNYKFATLKIL
jgi:hypothetical protein